MSNLDDVIGMTGSVASGGATQAPVAGDASTQSQFISTLFNQLVQSTRLAHELPDADDHKSDTKRGEYGTMSEKMLAIYLYIFNFYLSLLSPI